MPFGTVVDLGPGSVVLDGTQLPHGKGLSTNSTLHFLPHVYCGQTAGWIRIPLGTEVGLGPGDIVLDGYTVPPSRKGAQQPPNVAKRSLISETAELWISS